MKHVGQRFEGFENAWAIRHGEWLLIEAKNGYHSRLDPAWEARRGYPADDEGAVELYDLKSDLSQKHNLATTRAEKVAELSALLKQIREQGHSAPRLAGGE